MFSLYYSPITTLAYFTNENVIISDWITLFEVELRDFIVIRFDLVALTRELIWVCFVDLRFLLTV